MSLVAKSVFMTHARIEFSKKIIFITSKQLSARLQTTKQHTANPTRVAIDELQLHDLKNMDAADVISLKLRIKGEHGLPAVEVKQNARPARHDVAIDVSPPARGRDRSRPMVEESRCEESDKLDFT